MFQRYRIKIISVFVYLKGTVAPDQIWLKGICWIGLDEYIDGKKIFKCCLNFLIWHFLIWLYKKLSQRYCSALHAIYGFRRQYCIRRSHSDTVFVLSEFFSVFREIREVKGLFHVTDICKHSCYIIGNALLLAPVCFMQNREKSANSPIRIRSYWKR